MALTTDERLKIEILQSQVAFLLKKGDLQKEREASLITEQEIFSKSVDKIAEFYGVNHDDLLNPVRWSVIPMKQEEIDIIKHLFNDNRISYNDKDFILYIKENDK